MKVNDRALTWVLVVAAVVFVLAGIAKAAPLPCKDELRRVVAACRDDRRSPECGDAVDDLQLCEAEHGGDDPIGGADE